MISDAVVAAFKGATPPHGWRGDELLRAQLRAALAQADKERGALLEARKVALAAAALLPVDPDEGTERYTFRVLMYADKYVEWMLS